MTRYPTLLLISQLKEELDRMFDEAVELSEGGVESGAWSPQVDVVEAGDSVTLYAELPGVAASDLEIEVVGNVVTLRGRKTPSDATPDRVHFHRVERSHGAFERQIRVDPPVNFSQGKARLASGLLSLEFPKVDNLRLTPYRIAIEDTEEGPRE